MGLKHRIIGGVLLVVAASGAAGGYAFFDARLSAERAGRSESSIIVADAARDYLQTLEQLRSAVLRYAETNSPADKRNVMDKAATIASDIAHLSALVGDGVMAKVAEDGAQIAANIGDALDRLKVKQESLEAVLMGLSAISENLGKVRATLEKTEAGGGTAFGDLSAATMALLVDGARFALSTNPADMEQARRSLGDVRSALDAAKAAAAALPRAEKDSLRFFGRDLDLFRDGLAQFEAASMGYGETLRRLDALLFKGIAVATGIVDQERAASMTLASELRVGAAESQTFIMGASASALAVGMLVAAVMAGAILRPFERLRRSLEAIGRGDLSEPVRDADRRDEIGAMVRTLLTVRESLIEAEALRAAQAEQEHKMADARRRAIANMAEVVETDASGAVETVAEHTRQLNAEADRMLEAASRMSDAATVIRRASDESSAGTQNAATATEQLSAAAKEIAEQTARSTERIRAAAQSGRAARDIMRRLVDAIEKVHAIADMIDRIAGQTNMLALNATIEASRAGEAGRGFAVVAGEVKVLANQTAASTEDIRRTLEDIQSLSENCVSIVAAMGEEVEKIDDIAGSISNSIAQQHGATHEISRIVADAAVSVARVSEMIDKIANDATVTGNVAQSVRELSDEMAQRVDCMNTQIVGAVRRAAAA